MGGGAVEPDLDGGAVPGPWSGERPGGWRRRLKGDEALHEEQVLAGQSRERGVHELVPRRHFASPETGIGGEERQEARACVSYHGSGTETERLKILLPASACQNNVV